MRPTLLNGLTLNVERVHFCIQLFLFQIPKLKFQAIKGRQLIIEIIRKFRPRFQLPKIFNFGIFCFSNNHNIGILL